MDSLFELGVCLHSSFPNVHVKTVEYDAATASNAITFERVADMNSLDVITGAAHAVVYFGTRRR